MEDAETIISIIIGVLAGMVMAFGIVLVFEFLVGPDSTCQASLYVQVRNFAENI